MKVQCQKTNSTGQQSKTEFWRKLFGPKAYMVCRICGWRSRPYKEDTVFIGLGGQLSCLECEKHKRNQNLEAWGDVHVVIE